MSVDKGESLDKAIITYTLEKIQNGKHPNYNSQQDIFDAKEFITRWALSGG